MKWKPGSLSLYVPTWRKCCFKPSISLLSLSPFAKVLFQLSFQLSLNESYLEFSFKPLTSDSHSNLWPRTLILTSYFKLSLKPHTSNSHSKSFSLISHWSHLSKSQWVSELSFKTFLRYSHFQRPLFHILFKASYFISTSLERTTYPNFTLQSFQVSWLFLAFSLLQPFVPPLTRFLFSCIFLLDSSLLQFYPYSLSLLASSGCLALYPFSNAPLVVSSNTYTFLFNIFYLVPSFNTLPSLFWLSNFLNLSFLTLT